MSRFSYLFSTKNWLIAGACFLMTLEAFRTLVDNVHVVINRTDSLPIKAFVHLDSIFKLDLENIYVIIIYIYL
jgi:hypothetical protein